MDDERKMTISLPFSMGDMKGWQATPSSFNRHLLQEGVNLIIQALGCDDDPNFDDTPRRVADVYQEMFCPPTTGWPVFDESYTDEVIMRGHTFWTMCPHHLLPVKLTASVGYIPAGKVIGASKLVRMIHEVNTKPLTQEKLTSLIQSKIRELTSETSRGEAVMLTGNHGCFEIRGAKTTASMVTTKFGGAFDTPEMRERFFQLVRGAV